MNRLIGFIVNLFLLCYSHWLLAEGGINLVTRVIYSESAINGVPVKIANTSGNDFLLQFWLRQVDPFYHADKKSADFLVTPPLARLNGGDECVVRVIRIGGNLPSDRESLFFLATKMMPSQSKLPYRADNSAAQLQMVTTYNIPLFYRPKGLTGNVKTAITKLTVTQQANRLILHNPTPFYLQLANITFNGSKLSIDKQNWLAPFSNKTYIVPSNMGQQLSVSVVDEKGYLAKTNIEISK